MNSEKLVWSGSVQYLHRRRGKGKGCWDRPEFVTNSSEESESRHLSEEIPEPDPSEWKGRVQKIHDDPSEIDVGDDDEVELSEELQFLQVFVGLAID